MILYLIFKHSWASVNIFLQSKFNHRSQGVYFHFAFIKIRICPKISRRLLETRKKIIVKIFFLIFFFVFENVTCCSSYGQLSYFLTWWGIQVQCQLVICKGHIRISKGTFQKTYVIDSMIKLMLNSRFITVSLFEVWFETVVNRLGIQNWFPEVF